MQDDHGGRVEEYQPTKDEIIFAEKCLKASLFNPIYAKVDITYDNNKTIPLSVLELIEPKLWLRNNPNSANLFGEVVVNLISSK